MGLLKTEDREDSIRFASRATVEASFGRVGVDALEPFFNACEERRGGAVLAKHNVRELLALFASALEEQLHVDEDLIGVVRLLASADFVPEFFLRRAEEVRDEAVLLDISGREGAVEVVDDGGFVGGVGHHAGRIEGVPAVRRSTIYPKILA